MFKYKKIDDIDWLNAADDPRLADLSKKLIIYLSMGLYTKV